MRLLMDLAGVRKGIRPPQSSPDYSLAPSKPVHRKNGRKTHRHRQTEYERELQKDVWRIKKKMCTRHHQSSF